MTMVQVADASRGVPGVSAAVWWHVLVFKRVSEPTGCLMVKLEIYNGRAFLALVHVE